MPRLSFDDLRNLAEHLERHAAERRWPPGQIVPRTLQLVSLGQHTLDYHEALAQWRTRAAPPPEPVAPEEPDPESAAAFNAWERLLAACKLWHAQQKTTPTKIKLHPSVKELLDGFNDRHPGNLPHLELVPDATMDPNEFVVVEAK